MRSRILIASFTAVTVIVAVAIYAVWRTFSTELPLRLPTGRAQLAVTILRDSRVLPDDVEPPALLVSLRHFGP